MTERAYTAGELNALRQAVENMWLFGSYGQNGNCMSRVYMSDEKAFAVEQLVRTHMLAGHTAADLYASERAAKPGEPEDK